MRRRETLERCSRRRWLEVLLILLATADAFPVISSRRIASESRTIALQTHANDNNNEEEERKEEFIEPPSGLSRRQAIASSLTAVATVPMLLSVASSQSASAIDLPAIFTDRENSPYKPAKRPLAYRIDSTIPPTLLTVTTPKQTLRDLGQGSGTEKNAIIIDTVNLNNILNKIVFGTIRAVQKPFFLQPQAPTTPSFVCLGMPMAAVDRDVALAVSLMTGILEKRPPAGSSNTALGLAWAPYETQAALDEYAQGQRSLDNLVQILQQACVSSETIQLYVPLLQYAAATKVDLLALAPNAADVKNVLAGGLQAVDGDRRSQYVVDPNGFIQITTDPAFKMYTDRSLLKQDLPLRATGKTAAATSSVGNVFAASILIHEAAATKAAQYAARHAQSLVILVAPMADVRYQLGMNGRIPRIYNTLAQQTPSTSEPIMTMDRVTTILLNPTADDTLSKSKRLRLEIGTGPETLDYQQKIADYLWFSESPKVSLIPRLMN